MQSNHVKMVFLARCEKKLQRSRLRRVIAGGLYTNRVERSMLLLVSRDHVGSVRNKGCFEVNGDPGSIVDLSSVCVAAWHIMAVEVSQLHQDSCSRVNQLTNKPLDLIRP